MDELREKVARAIAESFAKGSPDIAATLRMDWQTWLPEADAALAVEPLASALKSYMKNNATYLRAKSHSISTGTRRG